jgi:acylglycerol lipase
LPVYREGFLSLNTGVRVFHRCWLPDSYTTLIVGVHGFAEHSGRYTHIGRALSERGYAFCIHDLRGHGRTAAGSDRGYVESFDVFLEDLRSYVRLLRREHTPQHVVLLGHSMGGLIVLHYLARMGDGVDAAVTSGAAAKLNVSSLQYALLRLLSTVAPRARINLPIRAELLSHDPRVVEWYLRDPLLVRKPTVRLVYELVRASKTLWSYINNIRKPILLLHGGEDQVVPPQASIEAYEAIAGPVKKLRVYPNLYHEILNEPEWPSIISDITAWIESTLTRPTASHTSP